MTPQEWVMLLIRWAHAVSAVAWVGASIFFYWVLRPSYRSVNPSTDIRSLKGTIDVHFRELVQLCTWAFIISGVLLAFDRLTSGVVGASYVVLLAVKVALAVWMFLLARSMGRTVSQATGGGASPGKAPAMSDDSTRNLFGIRVTTLLLILGLIVIFIAILLRAIYEQSIRGIG